MAKSRPAKIIMQQRKNFAAAKSKLVDTVNKNYIDPVRRDPNTPKKPRAKFGSWEGRTSTFFGLSPSQNENREIQPVQGALDNHIQNAQANAPESLGLKRVNHFNTGGSEHLATVTDIGPDSAIRNRK